MLAAFIQAEDGVILVLGLTPKDIGMLVSGVPAPCLDLKGLGDQLDCGAPTDLQIIFGKTEEEIAQRIGQIGGDEGTEPPADVVEQYLTKDVASPASMAATAAEEQAIKRAQSKLN